MIVNVEMNPRIVIVMIVEFFQAGHKAFDILRVTAYTPSSVYWILSNLRHGKGIQWKAQSPRSNIIYTKIQLVFDQIQQLSFRT